MLKNSNSFCLPNSKSFDKDQRYQTNSSTREKNFKRLKNSTSLWQFEESFDKSISSRMNQLSKFPVQSQNFLKCLTPKVKSLHKKEMTERDSISDFKFIPDKFGKKMKGKKVEQMENLHPNRTLQNQEQTQKFFDFQDKKQRMLNTMQKSGLNWQQDWDEQNDYAVDEQNMTMTGTGMKSSVNLNDELMTMSISASGSKGMGMFSKVPRTPILASRGKGKKFDFAAPLIKSKVKLNMYNSINTKDGPVISLGDTELKKNYKKLQRYTDQW